MNPDTFIGVDVSKGWLDYAITDKRRKSMLKLRTDNNLAGYRKLVKEMRAAGYVLGKKALVTMENIGSYQKKFVDFLQKKKCIICLDNPLRIKRSIGLERGKSDKLDAERILDYSIRHMDKLKTWTQPRDQVQLLSDLLVNRERLLRYLRGMQIALKEKWTKYKRQERLLSKRLNDDAMSGIEKSLERIEKRMDSIVDTDEHINSQYRLLVSVPGIGKIVALTLICKTNEFKRCNTGRQLASYVGVVPFPHESGTSTSYSPHISIYANKFLKKTLHIGLMGCLRKSGEFRKFYDRKVSEGKHPWLVINILKRKTLMRAAAVIQRGTPYVRNASGG